MTIKHRQARIGQSRERVLVSDATGRIGVLVDVLLERGHAVPPMMMRSELAIGAPTARRRAEAVNGDFDDPDTIARAGDRGWLDRRPTIHYTGETK
jgi:hypothetical protein